jgi:hypothetical protein
MRRRREKSGANKKKRESVGNRGLVRGESHAVLWVEELRGSSSGFEGFLDLFSFGL